MLEPSRSTLKASPRPSLLGWSLPVILCALVLVALLAWRFISRVHAQAELQSQTQDAAVLAVVTTQPMTSSAKEELVLPGAVQAWIEAPIYARTSGYLRRWLVDIGAPVKAGQLLAEIDAPEVDQQLRQAVADLALAQANQQLAASTALRYKGLLANHAVAAQDAEDKFGDAQAKQAALASAQANLQRLRELQGFERVLAPFDGVVTARNTDVGALVVAGGASGAALFKVAAVNKLRVYVNVPEALAAGIKPGLSATLNFAAQAGRSFPARVTSTALAITPDTRSLRTQLEVDNSQGAMLSGAYAEVHFQLPGNRDVLRVPANTVLFRADGLHVATIDGAQRMQLKGVTLGRDFGKEFEVLSGLLPTDHIVINPPDSAVDGIAVRETIAAAQPSAPTSSGSSAK